MDPNETPDDNTQSPLPEDNDTPFSEPTSSQDDSAQGNLAREIESTKIDDTHPLFDADEDLHEKYDEGNAGSVEAAEPNAGNAVVEYEPDEETLGEE